MIGQGVEADYECIIHVPSMYDTYMKHVELDAIGDTRIEDTRKLLLQAAEQQSILDFQNTYLDSLNEIKEDTEEFPFTYKKHQLSHGSLMNGGYDSY
jgi:hypothetical protein